MNGMNLLLCASTHWISLRCTDNTVSFSSLVLSNEYRQEIPVLHSMLFNVLVSIVYSTRVRVGSAGHTDDVA
jgi:hypothetical protein